MAESKNILLCVTGGIAVYKAVALTSKLVQNGFQVKVMMSENAVKFVTPLSFQAISRNDVFINTFDEKDPAKIAHIDLAEWPDLILIAPATANIIGKLACGIADDMISTTLLAATSPVYIAPSMNVHMYKNPIVQRNMAELGKYGYKFIEPNEGFLACGYVGKGRMEEPENIVEIVKRHFSNSKKVFSGKKILVTAGPTRERIDPVRFLTNYSTGKMGYSIARAAEALGAEVVLISGHVNLEPPANVKVINAESAEDMFQKTKEYYNECDILIKTAAVADYRPKTSSDTKIKKKNGPISIELERTKDILYELGKKKTSQYHVGFAAETDRMEEYAFKKLNEKNADMIVGNNISEEGAGFGSDTNRVTIYKKNGETIKLPKMTKLETAYEILNEVYKDMKGRFV